MTDPRSPAEDADSAPDRLEAEAFLWIERLDAGGMTRPELQAFKRWQGRSQAHAAAFEQAKRQWHATRPALSALLQADPDKAARHARLARQPAHQPSRRAFLGAAVGMATVAGIAVTKPPLGLWPSPSEWVADYRTGTGEQRTVTPADGVALVLNTRTSVKRKDGADGSAGIDLVTGEAAIDLEREGRPFVVAAGVGRSFASAGRFEVRNLQDQVCVTCIKGRLSVEHPAGTRSLQSGQQVIYSRQRVGDVVSVDTAITSAWREGELVFNQTPLAQVIAEINRYRPGRVMLMGDSQDRRPVVGRFRIAVLDEALLQLQHAFGLSVRSLPGGVLVLS